MARRKANAGALGLLIILGLVVVSIGKILDAVGPAIVLVICAAAIGGYSWLKISQRKARLAFLRDKYKDEAIVQRIIQRLFWEGQTSEQLIDSLGNPASVDHKMLKTRKREIWKYGRQGVNRYALRITLDEDTVVGWDQKSY